MYNVILINLAPEARAAGDFIVPVELRGIANPEMEILLRNFCEIDPVDVVTFEPEIRVKVRNASYLIRQGQKNLILYDALRRDEPAQTLDVASTLAELDGTAHAERQQRTQMAGAAPAAEIPLYFPPAEQTNRLRLVTLAVAAVLLLGTLVWRRWPEPDPGMAQFDLVAKSELPPVIASIAGVYLTGTSPGNHGIALAAGGDLKIFELGTVDAPRMISAEFRAVRSGTALALSTDQPGGRIDVLDRDTLIYCGEIYRRVP